MSNPIIIDSFQWGLANDKNAGQAWAFWNSSNIEYRRNSAYVELNKKSATAFSFSSSIIPRAITFWGSQSSIYTDIVVFTSDWVYTSAWRQSTVANIINVWEANSIKYFVTTDKIYSYTNPSTNTLLDTFNATTEYRPMIDWFWDLIIGNGTNIARINENSSVLIDYTAGATNWTIWWLDGTIYALTKVWTNIYVWCNNWMATNLYIWDWASATPSQVLTYTDKPVRNVALLWNMHYWWSSKWDSSIKEVIVWESYSPQIYVKSDYPEVPLSSNADNEKNRMAIYTDNYAYINAIETAWDIVYLPGYWRIFWFGRYFPWDKFSFNTEFSFTGSYITAMASGGITWSGRDAGGMLAYACRNGSNFNINVINLWQDGEIPSINYASSWFIESMEYIAESFAEWAQDKKLVIPYELPTADTSIKVYYKNDRASSYTLLKTITTADYWTWYHVAEITSWYNEKWRTKQLKFELITTDSTVTPKLYVGITNIHETLWRKS